jgi:tryptophanyl-tRNA synthetase
MRLAEGVADYFAPLRERRSRYEERPADLDALIQEGCGRAQDAARATMDRVRQAIGLG